MRFQWRSRGNVELIPHRYGCLCIRQRCHFVSDRPPDFTVLIAKPNEVVKAAYPFCFSARFFPLERVVEQRCYLRFQSRCIKQARIAVYRVEMYCECGRRRFPARGCGMCVRRSYQQHDRYDFTQGQRSAAIIVLVSLCGDSQLTDVVLFVRN